jgi:hypothetical protein
MDSRTMESSLGRVLSGWYTMERCVGFEGLKNVTQDGATSGMS